VTAAARLLEAWLRVATPWRTAAALAWAGLIWWASSQPARAPTGNALLPLLHNLAHVFAYAVLGALLLLSLRPDPAATKGWVGCALATAYGAADELHQSFVPGRVASLGDLATDLAGAVFGVALTLWLWRRQRGTLLCALGALTVGCASAGFETFFT